MDTLVFWKKKWDEYRDENDGDATEIRTPVLIDSNLQSPVFIMRDETNAKAIRRLKSRGKKQWW